MATSGKHEHAEESVIRVRYTRTVAEIKDLLKALDNPKRASEITRAHSHLAEITKRQSEISMQYMVRRAEQEGAPIIIRDAMLALLQETRANARRERIILAVAVASLLVSILVLLLS